MKFSIAVVDSLEVFVDFAMLGEAVLESNSTTSFTRVGLGIVRSDDQENEDMENIPWC